MIYTIKWRKKWEEKRKNSWLGRHVKCCFFFISVFIKARCNLNENIGAESSVYLARVLFKIQWIMHCDYQKLYIHYECCNNKNRSISISFKCKHALLCGYVCANLTNFHNDASNKQWNGHTIRALIIHWIEFFFSNFTLPKYSQFRSQKSRQLFSTIFFKNNSFTENLHAIMVINYRNCVLCVK